MGEFIINSEETFELKNIDSNDIKIKKFIPVKNIFQHLSFPIRVMQDFPNGIGKSYYIHPITYFSNFNKAIETDLEIDIVIDYCKFSKLKIYTPENYPEKVEIRIIYENVNFLIDELIINVVKQIEGYNFSLTPKGFQDIIELFKNKEKPIKNVFVPFDVKASFEYIHGPIENHVIPTLTGLSSDQLKLIRNIYLYDPVSKRILNEK